MRRVLVLTTVHHPDDTRIRERLCRTLASEYEVTLAAREPGPSDRAGLEWVALPGGRMRRWLASAALVARSRFDLLVLHDPETIPIGLAARRIKRVPVVIDVHEDVPAQVVTKEWIPRVLRPAVARLVSWLLRLAERHLTVTLAEGGYAGLFEDEHPVFPNHPDTRGWPEPLLEGDGDAIYVGDVTRIRGLVTAVSATGRAGMGLVVVGPARDEFAAELRQLGLTSPDPPRFTGRLSHREAMDLVRRASVGISPLHDVPNYRHSIPTKVLEYLALGVPVVATDLPGTRDLVEGLDAVWLVPAGDEAAMAGALSDAATLEAKTAAVAQAPEVRERFSWPTLGVLDFYRSLF